MIHPLCRHRQGAIIVRNAGTTPSGKQIAMYSTQDKDGNYANHIDPYIITERQHAITSARKLSRPFPAYRNSCCGSGHSARVSRCRSAPDGCPLSAAVDSHNCPEAIQQPQKNAPCAPPPCSASRHRAQSVRSIFSLSASEYFFDLSVGSCCICIDM
jgi:hypothetical protein